MPWAVGSCFHSIVWCNSSSGKFFSTEAASLLLSKEEVRPTQSSSFGSTVRNSYIWTTALETTLLYISFVDLEKVFNSHGASQTRFWGALWGKLGLTSGSYAFVQPMSNNAHSRLRVNWFIVHIIRLRWGLGFTGLSTYPPALHHHAWGHIHGLKCGCSADLCVGVSLELFHEDLVIIAISLEKCMLRHGRRVCSLRVYTWR